MRALLLSALLVTTVLSGCAAHIADVPENTPHLGGRLSPGADFVLQTKRVAISTAPQVPGFHLGYSGLFKAHVPMYFTADSLLHAFHRSYESIFKSLEVGVLTPELRTLLSELRQELAKHPGGSPEAREEVDFLLAVASSLLEGEPAEPVAQARKEDIEAWWARAAAEGSCHTFETYGPSPRPPSAAARLEAEWPLKTIARMDLSMLRPRGRYTETQELCRYFQALMWLGRAELRIASPTETGWEVNRLAMETVLLLESLLSERAELAWSRIDETSRTFVGPPDSMSFPGLRRAAQARKLQSVAALGELADADLAAALQPESRQRIASSLRLGKDSERGPINFLVLGQRYVFDSEVLSSVSYGALRQKRMMPSPLDVGWAGLRNPAALKLLQPELERHRYRDALDAVARRGDEAGPDLWEGSLYHLWLYALRGLSPDPQRDAALPDVMRSDAWARRLLNSQLASWAELRHDTILYAKQSYTSSALCQYPQAYVDPYPDFYRAFEKLAARGGALVERLPFQHAPDRERIVKYFERLGEVAFTLRQIAEREQRGEEMTAEQLVFMNHAVSVNGGQVGCDGSRDWQPGGWYADLYFDVGDVLSHEAVVADVHTQPTDEGGTPVGRVLHVGTGAPRLMTVTLETRSGQRTYQGFVSTYLEETTGDFKRMNNEEWRATLGNRADVPWMRDIVAP